MESLYIASGGSRGVRSSSDEPPFFPSDQLSASIDLIDYVTGIGNAP